MSFKISVVTATRNRKDFLPRCIESVANQPYADKEHVIIDGASTDGTVELLQEYAAKYPHIRWISELDSGLSEAFNKGLAMATGDAIGIIGDDDYYEPDVFGTIAAEFAKHPEAGIVAGNCLYIRDNGEIVLTQTASFTSRKELIQCWRFWCEAVTLPAPSTFIRRAVIEEVGGFEERDRRSMDYRHWIKITEKFSVHTVNQVFARFRCDEGTITFSQQRQQWDETMRISKEYWGSIWTRDYYDYLGSFLYFYQWRRVKNRTRRILCAVTRRPFVPR